MIHTAETSGKRVRGKVIAFGVAVGLALVALLPGAWEAAAQTTAGTPTPVACPEGFTAGEGGTCTKTVPAETHTGVTGTGGQTVTLGSIEDGNLVQVTIPSDYPAGATFEVKTESTITLTTDGEETRVTKVLSITCTGNCTPRSIKVTLNLSLVFEPTTTVTFATKLKTDVCGALALTSSDCSRVRVTLVSSGPTAASLDRAGGSFHSIALRVGLEPDTATAPLQAVQRIEARFIGDTSVIEADLPPGEWGLEFSLAPAEGAGPDAPSPADTGAGAAVDESGTRTAPWIGVVLAVAAITGAGLATRRVRR